MIGQDIKKWVSEERGLVEGSRGSLCMKARDKNKKKRKKEKKRHLVRIIEGDAYRAYGTATKRSVVSIRTG